MFQIRASASADTVRVSFSVDGRVACVDTRAPYACTVKAKTGVHRLVLRALARNGATQVGTASVRVHS